MDVTKDAILLRSFPTFARITMQDPNQFHASHLTLIHPPIILTMSYVLSSIAAGAIQGAYTYDAGSNIVVNAPNVKEIVELLFRYFPRSEPFPDSFGLHVDNEGRMPDGFNEKVAKASPVHTRMGDGPRRPGADEALPGLDGLPTFLLLPAVLRYSLNLYCVEFAYVVEWADCGDVIGGSS